MCFCKRRAQIIFPPRFRTQDTPLRTLETKVLANYFCSVTLIEALPTHAGSFTSIRSKPNVPAPGFVTFRYVSPSFAKRTRKTLTNASCPRTIPHVLQTRGRKPLTQRKRDEMMQRESKSITRRRLNSANVARTPILVSFPER